jgi:hypothetical protein
MFYSNEIGPFKALRNRLGGHMAGTLQLEKQTGLSVINEDKCKVNSNEISSQNPYGEGTGQNPHLSTKQPKIGFVVQPVRRHVSLK